MVIRAYSRIVSSDSSAPTLREPRLRKVGAEETELTLREYALITVAAAAFLLASLPFFLYLVTHFTARPAASSSESNLTPETQPS